MRALVVFLLLSSASARAQSQAAPPQPIPPAQADPLQQLQEAQQGKDVFDATSKKPKLPGEVVAEEKDVLLSEVTVAPSPMCGPGITLYKDAEGNLRKHAGVVCAEIPEHTVEARGNIQIVRPEGSAAKVRDGGLIGGGIGALAGALGFLVLLASPWGWAVGAATAIGGAAAGYFIGRDVAESKIPVTVRVEQTKSSLTTPDAEPDSNGPRS